MESILRDNRTNLIPVEVAARFCHWVLTRTTAVALNRAQPWCIYDHEHQPLWLAEGAIFPCSTP